MDWSGWKLQKPSKTYENYSRRIQSRSGYVHKPKQADKYFVKKENRNNFEFSLDFDEDDIAQHETPKLKKRRGRPRKTEFVRNNNEFFRFETPNVKSGSKTSRNRKINTCTRTYQYTSSDDADNDDDGEDDFQPGPSKPKSGRGRGRGTGREKVLKKNVSSTSKGCTTRKPVYNRCKKYIKKEPESSSESELDDSYNQCKFMDLDVERNSRPSLPRYYKPLEVKKRSINELRRRKYMPLPQPKIEIITLSSDEEVLPAPKLEAKPAFSLKIKNEIFSDDDDLQPSPLMSRYQFKVKVEKESNSDNDAKEPTKTYEQLQDNKGKKVEESVSFTRNKKVSFSKGSGNLLSDLFD